MSGEVVDQLNDSVTEVAVVEPPAFILGYIGVFRRAGFRRVTVSVDPQSREVRIFAPSATTDKSIDSPRVTKIMDRLEKDPRIENITALLRERVYTLTVRLSSIA